VSQHIGHAVLSDINISQGSEAMPLRCGGICNYLFTANFQISATIKGFGQYLAKLWTRVWLLFF